ncbi:MAG: putative DNA binding domain-containing protein [Treponema sp.]|nr:putative DNA binding domain-containing protein [Treponema sp.]
MSNTFLKTVSVYANYGTGQILFGVTDSGKEIGVENPDAFCLDIENKIKV